MLMTNKRLKRKAEVFCFHGGRMSVKGSLCKAQRLPY